MSLNLFFCTTIHAEFSISQIIYPSPATTEMTEPECKRAAFEGAADEPAYLPTSLFADSRVWESLSKESLKDRPSFDHFNGMWKHLGLKNMNDTDADDAFSHAIKHFVFRGHNSWNDGEDTCAPSLAIAAIKAQLRVHRTEEKSIEESKTKTAEELKAQMEVLKGELEAQLKKREALDEEFSCFSDTEDTDFDSAGFETFVALFFKARYLPSEHKLFASTAEDMGPGAEYNDEGLRELNMNELFGRATRIEFLEAVVYMLFWFAQFENVESGPFPFQNLESFFSKFKLEDFAFLKEPEFRKFAEAMMSRRDKDLFAKNPLKLEQLSAWWYVPKPLSAVDRMVNCIVFSALNPVENDGCFGAFESIRNMDDYLTTERNYIYYELGGPQIKGERSSRAEQFPEIEDSIKAFYGTTDFVAFPTRYDPEMGCEIPDDEVSSEEEEDASSAE